MLVDGRSAVHVVDVGAARAGAGVFLAAAVSMELLEVVTEARLQGVARYAVEGEEEGWDERDAPLDPLRGRQSPR